MIIYKALFFIILFAFTSCNISNSKENVIKNSEIQEKYVENITLEENFNFFINSDLFIQDDEFQKTVQREVEKTTANSIEVIPKIENYLKKEWKSQTKIFEFSTKEKSNLLIEIHNNSYINHSLEFIEIKNNEYFYSGNLVITLIIRNKRLNDLGVFEKKFISEGLIKSTAPLE